jgi:hypothetical protein
MNDVNSANGPPPTSLTRAPAEGDWNQLAYFVLRELERLGEEHGTERAAREKEMKEIRELIGGIKEDIAKRAGADKVKNSVFGAAAGFCAAALSMVLRFFVGG